MAERPLGTRHAGAAESPGLALWQVTNRWQAVMREALAPHDLTHVQYVLLACLVWLHGTDPDRPVTQAMLAEFTASDVMMTSQVLRTLERKGLLERRTHPTDRRARSLRPTAAGLATATRATTDVEGADERFFAPLEDAAAFHRHLVRLGRPGGDPDGGPAQTIRR